MHAVISLCFAADALPASAVALRVQIAGMAIATVVFCSGVVAMILLLARRSNRERSLLFLALALNE
jgi:hypothetical protein